MALISVFIFGSVVVFGLTAVAGLVWAIRTGQMRHFARGAVSIFDEDEPIGAVTDGFPGDSSQQVAGKCREAAR